MLFISENDAIMGGKIFGRGIMMNTNVLPKAVILDLDGTLLRSDKTVSERTLAVLEECKKKGMVVVVATARFWFKAEPFLNIIQPDYALLADGTMIFRNGELIHGFPMDINTSKGLINEFMSMEDGHDFVVGTGKLLLCSAKGVDEPWRQTYDFSTGFHKPAYKIASVMNSYEAAKKLADKFSCRLYSYRGEDLYAFTHKESGKYQAVCALGELLNIDLQDMIAFGDDENDCEVLKHCGKGIAVANAIPMIKDIADDITDSNDNDGVAKCLEYYFK